MKIIYDIEKTIDDSGTVIYKARKDTDFDKNGIPFPEGFVGYGETELYAMLDLLEKFASAFEYEYPQDIY
jgi:hypothetical protein